MGGLMLIWGGIKFGGGGGGGGGGKWVGGVDVDLWDD